MAEAGGQALDLLDRQRSLEGDDRRRVKSVTFGYLYQLNQQVALKQLALPCEAADEEDDKDEEKLREEFLNHMQQLKELDHENFLRFTEFECGRLYKFFVYSEFINGDTLTSVLKQQPLEEGRRRKFCLMICKAVGYLHNRACPIFHTNINGDNVMIEKVSDNAKLIDFGVSLKLAMRGSKAASRTFFNDCVDTLLFMAPEVLRGDKLQFSTESDIWSVGCTLYQMCSGEAPYCKLKKSKMQWKKRIDEEGAPRLPDECDGDIRDFYKGCVRRKPKKRSTADQLLSHRFLA